MAVSAVAGCGKAQVQHGVAASEKGKAYAINGAAEGQLLSGVP